MGQSLDQVNELILLGVWSELLCIADSYLVFPCSMYKSSVIFWNDKQSWIALDLPRSRNLCDILYSMHGPTSMMYIKRK